MPLGVRDEENESDDTGDDAEALTTETSAKEIGHRAALDVLRHEFGAATEDNPCQKRTNHGVANAYPCGRQTILPAELTGITDEDNGREIAGAKGKGRKPGTYGTTAKDETVNRSGLLVGIDSHANHHGQKDDGQENFNKHI